jgi:glucose-6-phosphate isomerase
METTLIDIEPLCGLPVTLDTEACKLEFRDGMNQPDFYHRTGADLESVYIADLTDEDRAKKLYSVSSSLWLDGEESIWRDAKVTYGLVLFAPGDIGGEYIKSSGQFHPILPGMKDGTPEIYSVLHGEGHFMLQHAGPPFDKTDDPVVIKVKAGEAFVVPPSYGHLQINPGPEPLLFSYIVMDGLKGEYGPYKEKKGAMYYEVNNAEKPFVYNENYSENLPLKELNAGDICQIPGLNKAVSYQRARDMLDDIKFVTDPEAFPASAGL